MKPLLVLITFVLMLLIEACSSSQTLTDIKLPLLVYQEPLPPFPRPVSASTMRIDLEVHVRKDGSVDAVRFLNSSGSVAWDSEALSVIHQWKYSPARSEDKPINLWIRQTAVVTFSDPLYIPLSEIICSNAEQADTVCALLEQGVEFSDLALKYSVASSRSANGDLGPVNIQIYPEHIKRVLKRLKIGRYTEPVVFGEQYAIFKRTKE